MTIVVLLWILFLFGLLCIFLKMLMFGDMWWW